MLSPKQALQINEEQIFAMQQMEAYIDMELKGFTRTSGHIVLVRRDILDVVEDCDPWKAEDALDMLIDNYRELWTIDKTKQERKDEFGGLLIPDWYYTFCMKPENGSKDVTGN